MTDTVGTSSLTGAKPVGALALASPVRAPGSPPC